MAWYQGTIPDTKIDTFMSLESVVEKVNETKVLKKKFIEEALESLEASQATEMWKSTSDAEDILCRNKTCVCGAKMYRRDDGDGKVVCSRSGVYCDIKQFGTKLKEFHSRGEKNTFKSFFMNAYPTCRMSSEVNICNRRFL